MRCQVDVIYCIEDSMFRCVRYAKIKTIQNICGSAGETLLFAADKFLDSATELIERSLLECESNFVVEPNVLYADDTLFETIQKTCMVVVFSRVASKKGLGIDVRSLHPQSERYTIGEPVTSKDIETVLRRHFHERYGDKPFPLR